MTEPLSRTQQSSTARRQEAEPPPFDPAAVTPVTLIEALPLKPRARNVLRNAGHVTVATLLGRDRDALLLNLLRAPNGSRKAINEINEVLNLIEPVVTERFEPRPQGYRAKLGQVWAGPWRTSEEAAIDDAVEVNGAVWIGEAGVPHLRVRCRIVRGELKDASARESTKSTLR